MARGDGIDRTNARNMRLTETKIGNTQQHNEREKDSYVNQDIVLERTPLNVHFKTPSAGYREMFARMEADGVISTRGIKEDAFRYGELVFDVNSAYTAAMTLQNNFTPKHTKPQSKSWAESSIFCRRSCTLTSATGPCPRRWGRTCTTTTSMWFISR